MLGTDVHDPNVLPPLFQIARSPGKSLILSLFSRVSSLISIAASDTVVGQRADAFDLGGDDVAGRQEAPL